MYIKASQILDSSDIFLRDQSRTTLAKKPAVSRVRIHFIGEECVQLSNTPSPIRKRRAMRSKYFSIVIIPD